MRSLISDAPPIEAILMASQAFWMNAMLYGDWAKGLQYSYHALKLYASVKDPSKHDLVALKYSGGLAWCCLSYFRATRGPCPLHCSSWGHSESDLLACNAACFIPEDFPIEMRLADSLYHLRHVPSSLIDCQKAPNARRLQHSQHGHIAGLLETSLFETSILDCR